ncbi:eCIS core domain-containing protein [Ralstonia pseudosolanacearum]
MPWYAPDWAAGITRGNDIYFRDPQQTFCTPRDVALLGHELIHVGQYREGMTWLSYLLASKGGYESNPYETAAYEMQRKIQSEVKPDDCLCKN